MIFGYVGICYKEAPLALRGQVALPDSKKIELWERLSVIGLKQCVIVSTCNRSEIFYFSHSDAVTGEQVQSCYQDIFPNVSFGDYCKKKEGSEAVSYLFRVAAGLESLVVGEDQILGQVVEAMDFARTMGHSGKELERIVRDAVTCAKWIKTNYRISEKPLSVSYIGVKELHRAGGVSGKNILVIGSGKTVALALTYLFEYGAKKIYLCSRTFAHAKELLAVHENLTVVDYHERYDAMKRCETVVSATSSPHLVVLYDKWKETGVRQMQFLDLASPRDIDSRLQEVPGVQLIDMDTLQKITEKNQNEREKLAADCEQVIEEKVQETMEWLLLSRVDGTIETLQKRCSQIETDSYEYLNRKIPLNHREQKLLKKVLHASLQRLIREPIQELKQLEDEEKQKEYQNILKTLFRMYEDE